MPSPIHGRSALRSLIAGGVAAALAVFSPLVAGPAFAAEEPFAVTSPASGSAVDSTTPTFTGTGTTGDTVTLTYSGQELGSYTAGTATVDEVGQWQTATSFASANPGETETRVRVVETTPDGTEVGTLFITITFPEAPVRASVFTLDSPQDGETRDDFLNIVHFTGSGDPGNTITVRYFAGGGLAVAGEGQVDQNGRFDVFATFRDLPAGQDFANTFTRQTTPAGDLVAGEIGRTIFFVNPPVPLYPFTVTAPANLSTVDSLTPAYTGTGTPGDTVTVSYSGQGLLTYVAGTTTVAEDGTWTIPTTDFSKAPFGDTEVRTRVVETTPAGVEENDGTLFITITFPTAPAVPVLDAPTLDQPTVAARRATFRGTGVPGATVEITVTGATTSTVTTTVRPNGSYRASVRLTGGSYTATATQYTDDGADRSAPSAARSFAVRR